MKIAYSIDDILHLNSALVCVCVLWGEVSLEKYYCYKSEIRVKFKSSNEG